MYTVLFTYIDISFLMLFISVVKTAEKSFLDIWKKSIHIV